MQLYVFPLSHHRRPLKAFISLEERKLNSLLSNVTYGVAVNGDLRFLAPLVRHQPTPQGQGYNAIYNAPHGVPVYYYYYYYFYYYCCCCCCYCYYFF